MAQTSTLSLKTQPRFHTVGCLLKLVPADAMMTSDETTETGKSPSLFFPLGQCLKASQNKYFKFCHFLLNCFTDVAKAKTFS